MIKSRTTRNMAELKEFIGIQAIYTDQDIKLSQATYTKSIVKKFGQESCKPTRIPMSKIYESESVETTEKFSIREAIGCLMYLTNATRPDIAFVVNNVSRHVTKPTKTLWTTIQRIFKYLNSTSENGITYSQSTFEIKAEQTATTRTTSKIEN
jgi:hypothetical protein